MRLQFLIRALSLGGAERQLVLLAEGLARRGHAVEVLTFYRGLPSLESRLERSGVRVVLLRKRGRADVLGFFRSLDTAIRVFSPDVIYSFLPTSNVVAAVAVRSAPGPALAWGIRTSALNIPGYDWLARLLVRAEVWLRRVPDAVICNSRAGRELYRALGFPPDRLSIARNIIDFDLHRFDSRARDEFRRSHGIANSTFVLGTAGRLDPVKGLENLIIAFAKFHNGTRDTALLVAGNGKARYRHHLQLEAERAGVAHRIAWLGQVEDMRAFYSTVDLLCLSSVVAEGTSNVIAEAMACGRMVVATEVGDSADLVGDASLMARPADPDSLAEVIARAASRSGDWNMDSARSRIASLLCADDILAATERALERAMAVRRARAAAAERPEA